MDARAKNSWVLFGEVFYRFDRRKFRVLIMRESGEHLCREHHGAAGHRDDGCFRWVGCREEEFREYDDRFDIRLVKKSTQAH